MKKKFFVCDIFKIVILKSILYNTKTTGSFIAVVSILLIQCVHKPSEVSRGPSSQDELTGSAAKYELCSKKNFYLENQMRLMPPEYFSSSANYYQTRIPIKCVQFAQRSFSGHYAVCSGEEAPPLVSEVRPCLSENYVSLVYNSYHDVMDCFNLDPRDFYLQIMIESGFHINAINKTGMDSGISQFTANGIKKVTANNLVERTRRILLESSRPSCQRISSIVGAFNIDAFSVKKRCSMISLPKNPYRAMLFNHLHIMLDQILLEEALLDLPEIQSALTDKIKRQLVFLSYNRGLMGVKRLLSGYITTRQFFSYRIAESDLDLNKNLSRVKNILQLEPHKREALRRAKVKNLTFAEYAVIQGATYISDMAAASDYVQRNLGNSCGEL